MVQPANKRLVTEATVGAKVAAEITTPGSAAATALSATILDHTEPLAATSGNLRRAAVFSPFASRTGYNGATAANLSNGTDMGATYRWKHAALVAAANPALMFANVYDNAGTETDGPNDINVRAVIEYPTGTYHPVFFAGRRTTVVEPGATLQSDPVGISIPEGATFWTRIYVTVNTSGQKWPTGPKSVSVDLEGNNRAVSPVDLSGGGVIPQVDENGYGPVAILGTVTDTTPVVGFIGDSIGFMRDDSGSGGYGFLARALIAAGIPYLSTAMSGDLGGRWAAPATRRRRAAVLRHAKHIICEYGFNDIYSNPTATVQASLITSWRVHKDQGQTVWQTTLTPFTTSTDSWATTGNQTISGPSGNTRRVEMNNWIRDGAPLNSATFAPVATGTSPANTVRAGQPGHPLSGYFEIADTVESARDSGIWKGNGSAFGYTTDGTHPSATGHTAMAAAVNTSVFA